MVATLILWGHALAALLFGLLAGWVLRAPPVARIPRYPLGAALALTALWALAVAGIGQTDLMVQLLEGARNLAWLLFMGLLHRRLYLGRATAPVPVYGVMAAVVLVTMALHIIAGEADLDPLGRMETAAVLLRMLVAVASLVLMQNLYSGSTGHRAILLALAALWLVDLNVLSLRYLSADWRLELIAVRGLAMAMVAVAIGTGLQQRSEWAMQVSRTVAYQSLTLAAIGLYFAMLMAANTALAAVGGDNARVLQTAFVFGSTAAILTLVSSPWLRAWTKVKIAKHFFRHRYDYRVEWMRFTETLGRPDGAASLDERIVKAIADLTDSPAGLLLVPDGAGLGAGASWNWQGDGLAADAALVRHLQSTGRILDLDALRAGEEQDGDQEEDAAAIPAWMLAEETAWVLVPLPHMDRLAGAILLARPPLRRALDWEDFDLLRVAGRQAASYLAESRAQEALAEAQRFDEFNRRFAFIMHDIKNLLSQLTLVARNAERHADNPEFRRDMVATLQDSASKMNDLLARLSQHHRAPRTDPPRAIDVVPLVKKLARESTVRHPCDVANGCINCIHALADPAALEQLLRQLIQNAIDASPADAPVTLAVSAEGAEVRIDVIDTGAGMSPAFIRDKLFKPFVSSKPGGFGIGVFEAQQLAAAMAGRIDVTSREGQGSRFRVTLKAARPADMEKAA